MIMMPYGWPWSSLQLTNQADFWHPTGRHHLHSADGVFPRPVIAQRAPEGGCDPELAFPCPPASRQSLIDR